MLGSYPVLIDGEAGGELTVWQEGLYTVFEARCAPPADGGIFRLSVYGEGEGYLGIMEPKDGALYLRRRFSRAALEAFPKSIAFAGRSGQSLAAEEKPQEPESAAYDEAPAALDESPDTLWRRLPGGYLMTGTDAEGYMAVPVGAGRRISAKALSRRAIDGGEYYIYEIKNGKLT